MEWSAALFIFLLYLGCFAVRSELSSEHKAVSSEIFIEENCENKYSIKPDIAETTTKMCSIGSGCGYQIYNEVTRKTRRFVEYCTCPENSQCEKVGDNVMYHLFYYQCQKDLDDDVSMPTHSSTTELPDILDSEQLTSAMQDSTEDFVNRPYMNRAYFTPVSTTKYSLNHIIHQSNAYPGFNEILESTPLNLEQDAESLDQSNAGFTIPIYSPADSMIGPSLDEITESSNAYPGFNEILASTPLNLEQDAESLDQSNAGFTIPIYSPADSMIGPSLDEITESSIAYPGSKLDSSPLPNSIKYEVKNYDPLFTSSKTLERVIYCDVSTEANIGRNCAAIEPSASNSDSKIFKSFAQKIIAKETKTVSFDCVNSYATETDCSTSGEQNALNSLVNEFSADGTAEATYEIVADAGMAVNVRSNVQTSLDNPVSNLEYATFELIRGKDEL